MSWTYYHNKIKEWLPIIKEIAENTPAIYEDEDQTYNKMIKKVIKEMEEI